MIFNTDHDITSVSAKNLVKDLNHIYQELHINLEKASKLQTKYYNKCHTHKSYKVDDYVYLNMRNFKTRRSNKKLDFKINCSFQIIEIIDKQVYKVKLLLNWQIHDMFYIFLLKQAKSKKEKIYKAFASTEIINEDDESVYTVEAITDS